MNRISLAPFSLQDWEPVVLRKKAPTTKDLSSESAVNAARRQGVNIDTVKKVSTCGWLYLDYLVFYKPAENRKVNYFFS